MAVQHTNIDPMTPEQWAAYRAEYARKSKALADQQRQAGDIASADLNDYLAEIYGKEKCIADQ